MTELDAALDAVPMIFDNGELLRWFGERGIDPTPEEVSVALARVGRIPAVTLLADMFFEDLLTVEAAQANMGPAWSESEYPNTHLDRDTWRWLFEYAGYTVDGRPAQRPIEPLTLWRGSVPERRDDWSWTDNREIAGNYASGEHYRRPRGKVWQATVEPWRLLARNTERSEHEYVVDTKGLTIIAVST